jgi:hypothetical protein
MKSRVLTAALAMAGLVCVMGATAEAALFGFGPGCLRACSQVLYPVSQTVCACVLRALLRGDLSSEVVRWQFALSPARPRVTTSGPAAVP